jgi:hypothetical protein
MKLCKDCKHAVMTNSLLKLQLQAHGFPCYTQAMCGHPKARRSVVNGDLLTSCVNARGVSDIGDGTTWETICGKGAELFEQREPEPPKVYFTEAMDPNKWTAAPGGICFEKYRADTGRPWWRRIFGG